MAKREMKTQNTEVEEAIVNEPVEEVAESEAEEVQDSIEPVEEVVEPEAEEVTGTVVGCTKLNVRKEAKKDGDILGTIPVNSTVVILSEKPVKGLFYKVRTESGLEGFCMKNYIKINK